MSFEHYYTEKPESALRYYNINSTLRGYKLELETSTGVFSPKKVDKATRLLVNNMIVNRGESFLDLGCGYGVIGIVAAKLGAKVVMVDINERALMLARNNVKKNHVSAEIIKSNSFSNVKGFFDNVAVNPPIAAGMKVCTDMITSSYEHLNKEGVLQLVARHNKGGSRLEAYMLEVFGNVKTIAKNAGFKVYVSGKN
ncbi:MAG: class I SAM-dependent methyltransferase [Nanoarchaeota archaeon]|nr:class I SAM-dependent methyltransferase [Nanoarchaeota archaeon]